MVKPSTLPGGTATQVLRPGLHQGRSAFITGAGSGIGRDIALRLMALGMDVFGTGISRKGRGLMTGQLIQIDGAAHLGSGLHMLAA